MLIKNFLYFIAATTSLFSIEIKEIVLCDRIENRDPKDIINTTIMDASDTSLYAFLNVKSSEHVKLFMVWKKDGQEHFRFPVDVLSSPRYRVWSAVKKRPGQWSIHIENDKKDILKDISFTIESRHAKSHEKDHQAPPSSAPVVSETAHHDHAATTATTNHDTAPAHQDGHDQSSKVHSPLRSLENPKN